MCVVYMTISYLIVYCIGKKLSYFKIKTIWMYHALRPCPFLLSLLNDAWPFKTCESLNWCLTIQNMRVLNVAWPVSLLILLHHSKHIWLSFFNKYLHINYINQNRQNWTLLFISCNTFQYDHGHQQNEGLLKCVLFISWCFAHFSF